eukprot:6469527-Amphidinium_carterae.2
MASMKKRKGEVIAAPEDDDGTEEKKRRGPISCKCCKRKPSQTPWAETQNRGGQSGPTGDKCLQCFQTWQKGFSYMNWNNYVTLMLTEDPATYTPF